VGVRAQIWPKKGVFGGFLRAGRWIEGAERVVGSNGVTKTGTWRARWSPGGTSSGTSSPPWLGGCPLRAGVLSILPAPGRGVTRSQPQRRGTTRRPPPNWCDWERPSPRSPNYFRRDAAGDARAELGHLLGLCPHQKPTLLPPHLLHPGLFFADGSVGRRLHARHLRGTALGIFRLGSRASGRPWGGGSPPSPPQKTNVGWLGKPTASGRGEGRGDPAGNGDEGREGVTSRG